MFDIPGRCLIRLNEHVAAIKREFPFYSCSIEWRKSNPILICTAQLQPLQVCNVYTVEIVYQVGLDPYIRILSPIIRPSSEYHTYPDGSLCLYHRKNEQWKDDVDFLNNKESRIVKEIMPSISEWIIFYELYLKTGKWEGREAQHS